MSVRAYHFPQKIIAVDFDGCLCKNEYPEIGEPNHSVIEALDLEASTGANVILWTCRTGELLKQAVDWCDKHCIPYSFVNENDPSAIQRFGGDTRKVYADEYWDDKAVVKLFTYKEIHNDAI